MKHHELVLEAARLSCAGLTWARFDRAAVLAGAALRFDALCEEMAADGPARLERSV